MHPWKAGAIPCGVAGQKPQLMDLRMRSNVELRQRRSASATLPPKTHERLPSEKGYLVGKCAALQRPAAKGTFQLRLSAICGRQFGVDHRIDCQIIGLHRIQKVVRRPQDPYRPTG